MGQRVKEQKHTHAHTWPRRIKEKHLWPFNIELRFFFVMFSNIVLYNVVVTVDSYTSRLNMAPQVLLFFHTVCSLKCKAFTTLVVIIKRSIVAFDDGILFCYFFQWWIAHSLLILILLKMRRLQLVWALMLLRVMYVFLTFRENQYLFMLFSITNPIQTKVKHFVIEFS